MYVRVKVTPGAKKESVIILKEDEIEISVREKAERNLANKRVILLVSGVFNVPEKAVRIVNGHRSPIKLLSIKTKNE